MSRDLAPVQVDRLESHVLPIVTFVPIVVLTVTPPTTTPGPDRTFPVVLFESVILGEPTDAYTSGNMLRLRVGRVERQDLSCRDRGRVLVVVMIVRGWSVSTSVVVVEWLTTLRYHGMFLRAWALNRVRMCGMGVFYRLTSYHSVHDDDKYHVDRG